MHTSPLPLRAALALLILAAASALADQDLGGVPLGVAMPSQVAANPVTNKIYVASSSEAKLTVIDGAKHAVLPALDLVDGVPEGLAVNPLTNTIYVAIPSAGKVAVIDGATDTVRARVSTDGTLPRRLAINPVTNRIFVLNTGSNTVAVLDGATDALVPGLPNPVVVGTSPAALAVNAVTNRIYVANTGANTVTVIDGMTHQADGPPIDPDPAAADEQPIGLAVDAVANLIYVLNRNGPSVSVIDGTRSVGPITPGVASIPTDVVVNPATNTVYVASRDSDQVAIFVGATQTPIQVAAQPIAVAVNPATGKAYVASSGSNFITVIENGVATQVHVGGPTRALAVNPITNRIYATIPSVPEVRVIDGAVNRTQQFQVGDGPAALAVNPVNQKVYVANLAGRNLSVIDPNRSTADHFLAGDEPVAVAVNPITERAYVANQGSGTVAGTVTIFSGGNGNPTLLTVPAGLRPSAVAVNAVTERVYVANSATDATGNTLGPGSVLVFNGAANNPGETNAVTVPVGLNPRALAINPVTNKIYVANSESNDVTVLDGTANTAAPAIPLGANAGPLALAVNPVTNKIYVASSGAVVTEIDGAGNATPLSAGTSATDVAVNPATNKVYVPTFSGGESKVLVFDRESLVTDEVPIPHQSGGLAGDLKVAVNVTTNQIYVSSPRSTAVFVIDGITRRTTSVPLPVGAGPSAIAVNAVTNRVFVSNARLDSVTMLTPVPPGQSNLATSILRQNRTVTTGTTDFPLSAVSLYGPNQPEILRLYYQLDRTTGPWLAATDPGASATARLPGLAPGLHVLHAFAADAQIATAGNTGPGASPIPGQVNQFFFRVIETPSVVGTFSFAVERIVAREEEPVVTLLIQRDRTEPASVEFRTVSGTALAGGDFTTATGTLTFGAGEMTGAIAVPLRDDDVGEGVEIFSIELLNPGTGSVLGDPGTAFVVLLDDDTPDNALSQPSFIAPEDAPAADASITVNLTPVGARWRLFGERDWRASGSTAPGLTAGNYGIEFQPLTGFVTPLLQTLPVGAGEHPTLPVAYEALGTGTPAMGSLRVTLAPATLGAARGWRIAGEAVATPSGYRDSDTTVLVPAGPSTIEFRPVAGRETPPRHVVELEENVLTAVTTTYLIADTSFGANPPPLPAPVGADARTENPFRFLGQIQTDHGFGTGFVPLERVVVTCAHVLFDDGALASVEGVRWFFQFEKDGFVTPPQIPRGNYTFSGYAAQRAVDNRPGESTPASQQLDAAALYFLEPAARGGASGFLASDSSLNAWLLDEARDKLLAGYPVEGVAGVGRLHATPIVAATQFSLASGRVFKTTKLRSFPGNSGGPLCVRFDDGEFYPAAIYLGGSGETLVRALDSAVLDLLERARVSGDGGQNNNGGGVIQVSLGLTGTVRFALGQVKVSLAPKGARDRGARWHLEGDAAESTRERTSGETTNGLSPASYTVIYKPVEGYTTPAPQVVPVIAGKEAQVAARYLANVLPTVTSPLKATADLGLPFTYTIEATFDPTSYTATGLPVGLRIDSAGRISGTPAKTNAPGDYPVALSIRNDKGTTTATLMLKLQQPGELTVAVTPAGGGSVPRSLLNTLRRVGSVVTITARPAAGFVFESWRNTDDLEGEPLATTATYRFTMTDRVNLTVRFVRNIFLPAQGAYTGLLAADSLDRAGRVQLAVSKTGTFTGTLHLGGISTALRGSFRPQLNGSEVQGRYETDLAIGTRSVQLALSLTEAGALTGTLFDLESSAFLATISAARGAFSAKNPATNFAGAYTAVLPITFKASLSSAGHGYGRLSVSRPGVVKFTGFLGDGTPVMATAALGANGAWPFFAAPAGKGVVVGTLTVTGSPPAGFAGELLWPRTADTARIDFDAARYQAPPVDYATATLTFDAALASSVARQLTIASNLGVAAAPDPFTVRFVPGSGLFSGRLGAERLAGAVLQRDRIGRGLAKAAASSVARTVDLKGP